MCTVLLPPGVNPIAVNQYINIRLPLHAAQYPRKLQFSKWFKSVSTPPLCTGNIYVLTKETFCMLFFLYFANRASQYTYLNIKRLHALNFIMSLFHASTCFEHHVLIVRRSKLYYKASGIITPSGGRPVHRLREDSLNLRIIIFSASSRLILR